jgi:hypothetical protein
MSSFPLMVASYELDAALTVWKIDREEASESYVDLIVNSPTIFTAAGPPSTGSPLRRLDLPYHLGT